MKVASRAVVGAGGALRVLDSAAPLTLRRVRCDDAGTCALCLVGTAAGPLPGDELALELDVADGARAELQATGASIAQGGAGRGPASVDGPPPAAVRMTARLGADAALSADPGPLIVCDGSRVDVALRLELGARATVQWLETVVLGRSRARVLGRPGDTGTGRATIRWDVTREGRPVLRQALDLADPVLRAWRGHVGGCRVLASAFVSGPGVDACTVVAGAASGAAGGAVHRAADGAAAAAQYAVAQRIDAHSVLVTVLADDVHVATAQRATLVAGCGLIAGNGPALSRAR